MKIRGYDVTKAQLGWVCDTVYRVTTAEQFSDEEKCVRTEAKWMWLAMYKGYRLAKRTAKMEMAKPGERKAKGWVE